MTRYVINTFLTLVLVLRIVPAYGKDKSANHVGQPGVAVDAKGGAVVDPTRNVLDLVESAGRRLDDLRTADRSFFEAEARHLREMAELRAEHNKLIRDSDKVTQEKVREVDVLGGRTEAERSQLAIETNRKLVEATATAFASQMDSRFAEVNKRMAMVESTLSEGRGRQFLADPAMAELIVEMKSLRQSRSEGEGSGAGMNQLFTWAMSILGALGTFGLGVYVTRKPVPAGETK